MQEKHIFIIVLISVMGLVNTGTLGNPYSSHQYPPPQAHPLHYESLEMPSWAKHSQFDNYDNDSPLEQYEPLDTLQYPSNYENVENSQYEPMAKASEDTQAQHHYHHKYYGAPPSYLPSHDQYPSSESAYDSYPSDEQQSLEHLPSGYSPYPQTKQKHHDYRGPFVTSGQRNSVNTINSHHEHNRNNQNQQQQQEYHRPQFEPTQQQSQLIEPAFAMNEPHHIDGDSSTYESAESPESSSIGFDPISTGPGKESAELEGTSIGNGDSYPMESLSNSGLTDIRDAGKA